MKSIPKLPSTIGNKELTDNLNDFKSKVKIHQAFSFQFSTQFSIFQFVSPLSRVEGEFSDQKDIFRSLFTFLKEESRSECHLALLQAIRVFRYVSISYGMKIEWVENKILMYLEIVVFTVEAKIC